MELKPSALASWTFLIVLVLLSIFYIFVAPILPELAAIEQYAILAAGELVIFGAPILFLTRYRPLHGLANMRRKRIKKHYIPFILFSSLAIMFLSFVCNYVSSLITPSNRDAGIQTLFPVGMGSTPLEVLAAIAAVAIIPAVVEELLVRGVLYSFYEKRGTITAMLVTAMSFAMLHIYPEALLSALVAGLGCAYILHVTNSVFACIFAHLLNNLYAMLISFLAANFTFNPYWEYFVAVNVVLFFLFVYLALGSIAELIRDDAVPRLTVGKNGFKRSFVGAVNSSGFVLFASIFLFRLALIVFFEI